MIPRTMFVQVALAVLCAAAAGADHAFRLERVVAIPQTQRLRIGLHLTGTGSLSGFTATIAHSPKDLSFTELSLESGILAGHAFDTLRASADRNLGLVQLTVDAASPIALPGGEAKLLDLIVSLGGGIPAGTVLPITFSGTPTITIGGTERPAPGTDGAVEIPNDNFLIFEDASAYPGQRGIAVSLQTFNKDPLMGLQVSADFSNGDLELIEITKTGTMTEALNAEFFEPIIDNQRGYFVLGILLEESPPFDPFLRFPAAGSRLRLADLAFDVKPTATPGRDVAIAFRDGYHTPPIANRVVVEHQSVVPQLINGTFHIGSSPEFVRGNTNNDLIVNVADPIRILMHLFSGKPLDCEKAGDVNDDGAIRLDDVMYLLHYLFDIGPIIPAPFPEKGLDPTPDSLSCVRYGPRR